MQPNTGNTKPPSQTSDLVWRGGACLLFSFVAVRVMPRMSLTLLSTYALYHATSPGSKLIDLPKPKA